MKRTSILCIALGILFVLLPGSARSQSAPHPRLLVTDSLAQEIWARIDTVDPTGDMWRKLEGRARYAASPSAWWGSFYRYREIEKLALAGLILQNSDEASLRELGGSYLDRAITICDTVILNDRRIDRSWTQLKAAHRVRALAVVYDLAYDRLGRSQREEFEDVILRDVYGEEGSHSIRDHFMNRANIHSGNHGADWATALLYAAIALEDEREYPSADHPRAYPGRLARAHIDSVRNWMFRNNDCYFKRMFGRDGACVEGLHYGLVNLGYTFCALQAFSVRDTLDWFRHPRYTYIEDRLSRFGDWIAHETIPHAHERSSPCDLQRSSG